MDLLWGPTRVHSSVAMLPDGRTNGQTNGVESCKRAKTLISDISNFYEASLENISTDCVERVLSLHVIWTISIATSRGRNLEILARLINASRDRELTSLPLLLFLSSLLFFSFFSRSSSSSSLAPPESVSGSHVKRLYRV